jgi:hypothetical protein
MSGETTAMCVIDEEGASSRHLSELGALLKKERNEYDLVRVEQVLTLSIDVEQKIERIKRIDRESQERKGDAGEEETTDDAQVSRNRGLLKIRHRASTFVSYLFIDYTRIRTFGIRTHTLTTGMFSLRMRVSKDIVKAFQRYLQPCAVETEKCLKYILDLGWMYLTKRQYNLVEAFNRLCVKISTTHFGLLDYSSRDLIDKLWGIEKYFFTMHYREEYLRELIGAVTTVLRQEDPPRYDPDRIRSLIKDILTAESMVPSLFNFLVALNMVKYRRFLTLGDLTARNVGRVVAVDSFTCHPEIQQRIDQFIKKCESGLKPLLEKRNALYRLRAIVPFTDSGRPDYSVLYSFYAGGGKDEGTNDRDLESDRSNAARLLVNLHRTFTAGFLNLLDSSVETLEYGPVTVFRADRFSSDLFQLQYDVGKIERRLHLLPEITLDSYVAIKQYYRGLKTDEAEVVATIEKAVAILVDLGEKLAEVIRRKSITVTRTANAAEAGRGTGRRAAAEVSGGESARIAGQKCTGGMTILEALTYASGICYLTGALFGSSKVAGLLQDNSEIEQELREKTATLERLADRRTFKMLKNKYDLDLVSSG